MQFTEFDNFTTNHPNPLNAQQMRQMDAILVHLAGRHSNGRANLRFVWGADREATKMLVQGQWVGRYLVNYKREMQFLPWGGVGLEVPLLEKTEILLPRFIIEQLDFPRLSHEAWEEGRWRTIDGIITDWRGPYPEGGYYRSWLVVATHDARCCGGTEVIGNKVCHGFFKLPGDAELEQVAAAIQEREQRRRTRNLDDPYSHIELQEASVLARERRLAYWKSIYDGFLEVNRDFERTHQFRVLTDDPSVLSHGKFHFLSGHNRAGRPKGESCKL